ncbi:MAG: DUF4129 domain-containing protein [Croceivirga sp.]
MKQILLFILCISNLWALAQQDSITVGVDKSSNLNVRPKLENLSKKYIGKEFNYDIKTGESQNLLSRFFNWLNGWLGDTFGIDISPEVFTILKWLIYIIMGGLIIYLIIRLLINERFEAIFTKKAKTIHDIELTEQHIEQVDFDRLLSDAINEKNYRLAVRYHFLRFLKNLSKQEIIEWHFEKTNADYRSEIQEPRLKGGFTSLAYVYDYIWYGEQPIDETRFQQVKLKFDTMNQMIAI